MFKKHKKRNPFLYYLITGSAFIFFWRGVWGLLDIYLFPNFPILSYIISALTGVIILYLNDYSLKELEN